MPTAARDDQFTLRGTFAERLTLAGSRASVYRFLANAETLLPLVPGVDADRRSWGRRISARLRARRGGRVAVHARTRTCASPAMAARVVTLQSVPTDIPPLEPKGALGDFTAVLTLSESGRETAIDGNATLSVDGYDPADAAPDAPDAPRKDDLARRRQADGDDRPRPDAQCRRGVSRLAAKHPDA